MSTISSSSPKSIMGGRMAAISTATIKYNMASINLNDNLSSSSPTASILSSPSLLSLTSRKSQSPSKISVSKSLHNSVVVHNNNISSTILNKNPRISSTVPNKIIPPLSPKKKKILDGFVILEASGMSLPDDVLIISLSSRDFVQVGEDDLTYFTELRYVDVSENQLSLSSFQHLTNLQVLKISSNSINHLSQMHITSFRSLSSSSSSSRLRNRSRPTSSSSANHNNNSNSRDNIVTPAIVYNNANCFPNLIVLDISYNALTYRDMLILGYLPQLKELDISGNDLNVLYRNNSSATNYNNNYNSTMPLSPSSSSSLIRLNSDELIPETNTPIVDKANNSIDAPSMATNNNHNNNNSYAGYDDFDDDYYSDDEQEEEEEEKTNDRVTEGGGGKLFIDHNGNSNYFDTNNKQPSQQQQRSRPNTISSNRVPNLKMDGLFLNLEQIVLDYNGLDNAMIFMEFSKLPKLIHISAAHNFLSTLPFDLITLPSSSSSGQNLDSMETSTTTTTTTGSSTAFR